MYPPKIKIPPFSEKYISMEVCSLKHPEINKAKTALKPLNNCTSKKNYPN
jgi:hypothetical protein